MEVVGITHYGWLKLNAKQGKKGKYLGRTRKKCQVLKLVNLLRVKAWQFTKIVYFPRITLYAKHLINHCTYGFNFYQQKMHIISKFSVVNKTIYQICTIYI